MSDDMSDSMVLFPVIVFEESKIICSTINLLESEVLRNGVG